MARRRSGAARGVLSSLQSRKAVLRGDGLSLRATNKYKRQDKFAFAFVRCTYSTGNFHEERKERERVGECYCERMNERLETAVESYGNEGKMQLRRSAQ